MITSHFNNSRWRIVIGLPMQLGGLAMRQMVGYPVWQVVGWAVGLVGTVLLGFGLAEYARAKGRDPALEWLTLSPLFGPMVLGSLEDLTLRREFRDRE